MNYLTTNLKETLHTITNNKKFFILLILLQIIIFTLFAIFIFNFAIKIISNLETITQTSQDTSTAQDYISIDTDKQLQNALAISTQLKQITTHLLNLSIILTIIYLLGNSLLWSLSHKLVDYNNNQIHWNIFFKNLLAQSLKFITTTIIILTPFYILAYYLITTSISHTIAPETFSTLLKTLIGIKIFLYFFLLITYAYIFEPSWQKYFKYTITSFKKIHYILLTTALNLLILSSILYLTYLTVTIPKLETLSIILTFLFITLLVITRLHWIVSLKNITLKHP